MILILSIDPHSLWRQFMTFADREALVSGAMLNDSHLSCASILMKQRYPAVSFFSDFFKFDFYSFFNFYLD
jgi:hypothetical protein